MGQVGGRARTGAPAAVGNLAAAVALAVCLAVASAGGAAAQSAAAEPTGEFDRLIANDPSLQRRADGRAGVAEDRSFYRTSRPRSPKALGFGASPTDPFRNQTRPDLIYDEVLQSFRAPFEPDR
ncbi:MAG: hypothetical protein AAF763_07260 [Pseudomonadota bacterium]